ncbi:hypothetical protein [Streptomyces rhizosphaericus]|uniref:LPXTG cell wall anchor domain-containing protein n=1 Tax=Streptomyces rhizosphaericus TaxID=114699 RepID=A0A6G4AL60_9ACTN|nr:hypothetical protein [Streptomyces rhizosphaericus]NEW73361.1 hypothetical protein [Streptomyces rhizosphaericus]
MRLPTALSLRAVLPAAALAFAPALYGVPAYAAEAEPAACGDRNASDFPIEAHLRGGPDQYALGGGWRGWHLELRNATDTGCRAIHPIAVLVDQARQLRPRHIGFEFLDPAADGGATWRTVSFQTTDEDENIGVFEDHFKGFTVPAHKTVDVQVRTRFTADAPEGSVTANAIAVQRRADDGDWVGQSNDYVFRIGGAAATGTSTGSGTDAGTAGTDTGTGTVAGTKGPDAGTRTRAATRSGGLTETGTDTGVGAGAATDGDDETTPAPEPTTRSKRPTATSSRTAEETEETETPSAAPSRKPSATRSPGATHKESSPAAVPPRADSDVDADTEADADADVGVDTDVDTDTDTDTELGADVDTDMDTDLGADTGSDLGSDLGSDSDADADTGTDAEAGTDTGTDSDTGTDLDEGLDTDPGTDTDLGTETDPGTDTGLGTETDDPGAEADLGTETDPGTETGREPQAEPSTGTGGDGRHEEDGGHEREHERIPELAATGRHTALLAGLGVISAALVTCGTVLVVKSRRSGV